MPDPQKSIDEMSEAELATLLGVNPDGSASSAPAVESDWRDSSIGSWLSQAGGGAMTRLGQYRDAFIPPRGENPYEMNSLRDVQRAVFPVPDFVVGAAKGAADLGRNALAAIGQGDPGAAGALAVDIPAALLMRKVGGAAMGGLNRAGSLGTAPMPKAPVRPPLSPVNTNRLRPLQGSLRAEFDQGGQPLRFVGNTSEAPNVSATLPQPPQPLPITRQLAAPPVARPMLGAQGPPLPPQVSIQPPAPAARSPLAMPAPPSAQPMGIANPRGLLNPAMPQTPPPPISMQNAQGSALSAMGAPTGAAPAPGTAPAINAQMVYQEFLRLTQQQGMSPQDAIRFMGFR